MFYYREKEKTKNFWFSGKLFALFCLAILSMLFFSGPISRTNSSIDFVHPKVPQKDMVLPTEAPTPMPSSDLMEPSFKEPAVGVLTSPFGSRWGRNHNGIDIGAEHGSDILAADGGTILLADWVEGYGNYLIIDHENGFQTAYAHCSELLVSQGEKVSQGQVVALVGNTGNSTGPHLHFEIKFNDVFQNPLDYVMY